MGSLHHVVGVTIMYLEPGKIWIGQTTYIREVLQKFNIHNSKSVPAPVEAGSKLVRATDDDYLFDQDTYQSAVGLLIYLSTKTRPDIAYAVRTIARHTSKPTIQHWTAIKHILRYLNDTIYHGLLYGYTSCLIGYSDTTWAGDIDDHKPTTSYDFKMSGAAISWINKKQTCVALSTAEVEYTMLSTAAQETFWLLKLLQEIY